MDGESQRVASPDEVEQGCVAWYFRGDLEEKP